jgi:selenocysteine lyase/cysteine desulfurase
MFILDKPVKLVGMSESETGHAGALAELERGVQAALETYSNVHRGTGHYSMVSTALFDQARDIVLEYLGLDKDRYVVVFCTPRRSEILEAQLKPGSYQLVSSQDIGLPLGIRALAVERKALPKGIPFETGGEVIKVVSPNSVVWADAPHKFEAGTPSIINVIAFAKALEVIQRFGNDVFKGQGDGVTTETEILYQDELWGYSGKGLLLELRKTLVGRDLRVPTAEGEKPYINLDNGASTPTFYPIWDVVRQTWRQPEHVRREIVREGKAILAEFLGAPPEEYDIIFTSNTTEALNIAAQSLGGDSEGGTQSVVLNTFLEHHSNELPWRYTPGVSLIRLSVDDEGFVDLDELEGLLREYNQDRAHGKKRVRIVAVSGASNVLGSFNDIQAISRIAHKYGARILVDGAQLVAHRRVQMEEYGIDYLAFSGHKVYAPFGSGALVVRRGLLSFDPAELAKIKASGEENVVGIAAMGKAIMLLQRVGMDVIEDHERGLTRRALQGLSGISGIEVFGVRDPDSPRFHRKGGVIVFSLKRVPHNLVAKELAEQGGIGVRSGCFCAHLISKHLLKIHPVRARRADLGLTLIPGFTSIVLPGLVRVSFGIENDANDVDTFIQVVEGIASAPRFLANRLIAFTHNGTPFLPHTAVQDQMRDFAAARSTEVYSFGQDDLLNEEAICRRVTKMPNQAIVSQVESLRRSLYAARRV